ncbi:MAG TPA: GNAT family protein [Acidimicrobiales bacterium]|nr:GNAT family protein [Acidimicrobiales bacterium]
MAQSSASTYWPLFDLSIRTPRVELRYPDDDLVLRTVELAGKGIHDPATMPFGFPWTDAKSPEFERNSLKHWWRNRVEHTPDSWNLNFVVLVDGDVVGSQGATASNFGKLRQAETGSWLGRDFQGQGIGKEMRAAILHFLFAGLDAARAISGAWHDNPSSLGVSRALGYTENGSEIRLRRDTPDRLVHLLLTREQWEPQRRSDIEIVGLDGCRDMLIA